MKRTSSLREIRFHTLTQTMAGDDTLWHNKIGEGRSAKLYRCSIALLKPTTLCDIWADHTDSTTSAVVGFVVLHN